MNQSVSAIHPVYPEEENQWDTNVHHPLQTWEWGEFRKKMGIDVIRLVAEGKKEETQYWQLSFHKIPHAPYTVGYFPKGPMPDQFMINALTKLGKEKKAIYIQLEPNIQLISNPPAGRAGFKFQISNCIPSHHPLFTKYTFVLDITKSEDELLKNMHHKTRYNIKVAQKHGVVIKEDSSDGAFKAYLALSEETTQRQGFYAHNTQYHQTMWNTMRVNGLAKLFTASYNGEILTTWIIFCLGDTMYYPYGASSRNHREVMAPNLLLWELIRWGKAHGYKKFDLWGAMGPNPDPNDPWYGFHRFKEGYHPELVEFIGSYDLVINPLLYKLYCLADTVRWTLLKQKNKIRISKYETNSK